MKATHQSSSINTLFLFLLFGPGSALSFYILYMPLIVLTRATLFPNARATPASCRCRPKNPLSSAAPGKLPHGPSASPPPPPFAAVPAPVLP